MTVNRPALVREGSDDAFRSVVHGLLAFTARLEAVRQGLGGLTDLSGPQYTILISIAHLSRAGDVSVSTVASHLHYSGAFVTAEVGRLAKKGLVEKAPNPSDGRRVNLTITHAGTERLNRMAETQAQVNDTLFAALGASDFDRLRVLLPGLIAGGDNALALLDYETQRREIAS
ncbi:MarR family winged helix-turn-helix transcriptional regulator [Acuticoccus yangtzensis]|uniref:MarR family winged helix-turn-helix transcriptional regulator n=1 Tax=Acuticoccus yangtzensis TaxID=1443441 RepID=UPI000949A9C5|nr:MarR family transcriptional regulator [Acuticoccus yangtzensis]ORE96356.1 regulatory protein [Stappia sp. 22II-S9-Z10]